MAADLRAIFNETGAQMPVQPTNSAVAATDNVASGDSERTVAFAAVAAAEGQNFEATVVNAAAVPPGDAFESTQKFSLDGHDGRPGTDASRPDDGEPDLKI